jgi:hypothetical protein
MTALAECVKIAVPIAEGSVPHLGFLEAQSPRLLNFSPETIECPLRRGRGQLSRTEILERLGIKDFTRVAQLSAEEAMRLVLTKEKESGQSRWAKFEVELTK